MKTAQQRLEEKGYKVIKEANMEKGILNEECPEVYKIIDNETHREVYGANAIAPKMLIVWADDLAPEEEVEVEVKKESTAKQYTKDEEKAKEWDQTYNEGAEGYNPYR